MNVPGAQNTMFINDLINMTTPPLRVWVAEESLLLWRDKAPRQGYYIHDLTLCAIEKETWARPRELVTYYNHTEKKYELYTTDTGLPVEVVGRDDGVYFAAFMLFVSFVLGMGVALLIFWKQGKI